MFKKLKSFFRHPIIYLYDWVVQTLERISAKRLETISKKKKIPNLKERIEKYHEQGFTNYDILKNAKSRERANRINKKAGSPLQKLSPLPSPDVVSIEKQREQVEQRKTPETARISAAEGLKKSISTILRRLDGMGVNTSLTKQFRELIQKASPQAFSDFYKNNKDEFESIFIKYMGSIDDVEEVLKIWISELGG